MAGRVIKFEELSSNELISLDMEHTAVFLAVSPIEGHGSHLPLGVDYFDALFFSEMVARTAIEKRPEFDAVIFPGIPLGTQLYRQPGSVRIGGVTLFEVIKDIGLSLALWGFKYIFLVSGHGSPKDIVALEVACRKVSRKCKVQMHNLSGAMAIRFLKGEYADEISAGLSRPLSDTEKALLKKDIHGGWWETSMMLYLRPDLVNEDYKSLPDTERQRKSTGPNPGYYGSPSRASKEFAEASLRAMTKEIGFLVDRCFSGEDITSDTLSPLYKIPLFRPKFRRFVILAIIAVIKLAVISWILYRFAIA